MNGTGTFLTTPNKMLREMLAQAPPSADNNVFCGALRMMDSMGYGDVQVKATQEQVNKPEEEFRARLTLDFLHNDEAKLCFESAYNAEWAIMGAKEPAKGGRNGG